MTYPIDENILYIFTDGASRPALNKTPKRVGGMGIFFVYCGKKGNIKYDDMSDYIGYVGSTNNDMELLACIEGLKIAHEKKILGFKKIIVVSDSKFVVDNSSNAIFGKWSIRGRKTISGDPIIHKPDWKKLTKCCHNLYMKYRSSIKFDRVKGHKDNEYNNMADKSAVRGAQTGTRKKISLTSVRKFFLNNGRWYKTGFLPIEGTDIYIHPYTHRPIKSKGFRCNYELVSWDHKYFNNRGWIYSKKAISSEFIYLIHPAEDGSHRIEYIVSTHTKNEIKEKMMKLGFEESFFYSGKKNTNTSIAKKIKNKKVE